MSTTLRHRIEQTFVRLGHLLIRFRWGVVIVLLGLMGGLASGLTKLEMDTSTESFLHENDPSLLAYNTFRDQFGRDELVAVAIEAPDVFDPDFLRKLKELHVDLRDHVPHLDKITSLINARNTRGQGDELIVEDLLQTWPETPQALAEVKARALANPLYRNTTINDDGTVTMIILRTDAYSSIGATDDALAGFVDSPEPAAKRPYLTDAENSEVAKAVLEIVAKYDSPGFSIHTAGTPVVVDALKRAMQTNMGRFTLLSLAIIAASLLLMFRRPSGVILPFVVVLPSLLASLGLMGHLGVKFTIPIQILPSFLLAVGVGGAVHVLAITFDALQRGKSRDEAIVYTLGHSGLAVIMTSLTTAAGLLSFAGSETAPIAALGLFSSFGVMIALANTILLLPALMAILPLKAKAKPKVAARVEAMDRLLIQIADFSVLKPWRILGTSAALLIFGFVGLGQLYFSHAPFTWLPADNPARAANDFIDARMKGASALEVVIDTGRENGLYEPAVMAGLERLARDIEPLSHAGQPVGKVLSVADILKETNKALHSNDPAFYTIPEDRALIAQEMFLFENSGSQDLKDFVDSQFSKARFTIKMPWLDAIVIPDLIAIVQAKFAAALPQGVSVEVTGMMEMLGKSAYNTIMSSATSYLIAGVVITLMMVLLIGDLRVGLVAMIPNFSPIVLTLGVMGWVGVPVDMFNILIGSIAIGLVVDDTIHFMHNSRRYHHDTGDVRQAVRLTLTSTGRAMFTTSVVLCLGFLVYGFSVLNNLIAFGLFTAFAILTALLADFFMAPALMSVLHKAHLIPDDSDY